MMMKTLFVSGTETNIGRIPLNIDMTGVEYVFQNLSGAIWSKGDGSDECPTDDIRVDGLTNDKWEVSRDGRILEILPTFQSALHRALEETKNNWQS